MQNNYLNRNNNRQKKKKGKENAGKWKNKKKKQNIEENIFCYYYAIKKCIFLCKLFVNVCNYKIFLTTYKFLSHKVKKEGEIQYSITYLFIYLHIRIDQNIFYLSQAYINTSN